MSTSAPKLFVSYRREETAGHAGRLYDAIAERFGESNVFMDVAMAPGVDFVKRIREAVGGCHVLVVVMGPRWATLPGEDGTPRVADPDDFVSLEVEAALRRDEVTVIPVLVAGAKMPDADDLPAHLRALAHRNALELSDLRWRYDVGRLIGALEELLGGTTAVHPTPPPAPSAAPDEPRPHPAADLGRLTLEGALVAAVAGIGARALVGAAKLGEFDTEAAGAKIAATLLRRGITWGVVGAALAIWLAVVAGQRHRIAPRAVVGLLLGVLAGVIGGAVSSVPAELHYSPDPAPLFVDVASLAVTGALLGALIGAGWCPRRTGTGLAAGMAAGALSHLLVDALAFEASELQVAVQAVVIAAATIALLALDAEFGAAGSTRRGHEAFE